MFKMMMELECARLMKQSIQYVGQVEEALYPGIVATQGLNIGDNFTLTTTWNVQRVQ